MAAREGEREGVEERCRNEEGLASEAIYCNPLSYSEWCAATDSTDG